MSSRSYFVLGWILGLSLLMMTILFVTSHDYQALSESGGMAVVTLVIFLLGMRRRKKENREKSGIPAASEDDDVLDEVSAPGDRKRRRYKGLTAATYSPDGLVRDREQIDPNHRIEWAWSEMDKDEMDCAYERLKTDRLSGMLNQMENQALEEARANCRMVTAKKGDKKVPCTPEMYDMLDNENKENLVCMFGIAALKELEMVEIWEENVVTTDLIGIFPACAMFQLLERLEELDGLYDELKEKSDDSSDPEELPQKVIFNVIAPKKTGRIEPYILMLMAAYPWADIKLYYKK